MNNKEIGKLGEDFTVEFLSSRGFIVLERNYKVSFGEIDIIARKGDILIFVEVKTRRNLDFGMPVESVSFEKQNRIKKIAEIYVKNKQLRFKEIRFDIMSIILSPKGEVLNWEYLPNAF
ncbi:MULTISPECIES: YraN family protein [Dictyoglomus]|jgi:putative endonuclease|uniref:UPF0102 protein Dtur_1530 n=1 Tax=Dictyoglomus turgidum (strain DSM 6724 / Z-1310) TaxID=515635 RepID=Y1530_DICTD|nr:MULTISPECIES: YraN family protein [Dictyoglomus]B8E2G0.1 RecName: Full=UPF0102 protein Dtur_1530 [Dictyoglomus turgidum DSM 6724]ACK42804.1 protein of unknown function UPF0102 [Dictyoglomus turgidum DSM 6724]PNV80989.1 MAG: YraN family protein [Dictyoglomus turgidum]HBU30863.1 YraN family protein [Dictyoglomus sp.]